MRNLVICPSIKPHLVRQMLWSFHETAKDSDIIIDDTPGVITPIINKIFRDNPGYEWYTVTNDDFVFRTEGWDVMMMKEKGLHYGNDLFQGESLPTCYMVHGEIAHSLGWVQCPMCDHLYSDLIWLNLAKMAQCLYYHSDVVIEHVHYENNKREKEESDFKVNNAYTKERGKANFLKWLVHQSHKDVQTIREVLNAC